MAEKKARKTLKRTPEEKDKEEIFKILCKEYREAPEDMWSSYPEIAYRLENFFNPLKAPSRTERPHYFYLTERDRDFRLKTLKDAIKKFQREGVSKVEAIKALEDAAALREYAFTYEDVQLSKDVLLSLLEKALGFSLDAAKEKTAYFQKGKPEHHTYSLARGITLSLTWDRKIIKIVFDPEEFALRQKALSFVGAGSDKEADVARKHDHYLEDSFGQ